MDSSDSDWEQFLSGSMFPMLDQNPDMAEWIPRLDEENSALWNAIKAYEEKPFTCAVASELGGGSSRTAERDVMMLFGRVISDFCAKTCDTCGEDGPGGPPSRCTDSDVE